MQNLVNTYLEKFKRERHVRRRLTCLLLALALVVSTGVYWQLHLTGAALTNEVYCGLEEHTHTDECYEEVLVCTQEESEGHIHTDDCYETVTTLVCTQEESEGHAHTDECYDADGNLICGLEESEGHTHTEDCYETEQVLACELEESEGHTHTEDCYETQLVCTKEEHTHTIDCMVDETADVETADIWEATLPELTGVWADDVVAIATSQLGYTESTANFTLDEDGVTRRGYTRYGAWAGNEYGDWDAMFASFCLYYAGISTEDFPEATGAYAWSVTLQGLGLYASAAEDAPLPGDLVFLDADEDGKIDRVGIVTAVAEDGALTVIEGNYAEDEADAVCETEYAAGSAAVVGYGFLPSSDEAAAVNEDGDESEAEAEASSEVEAEESAVEAEESEAEAEEEADESAAEAEVGVTSMLGSTLLGATSSTLSPLLNPDYYKVSWKDVTYSNGKLTGTLYLDLLGVTNSDYIEKAFEDSYTFYYYLDMFEDVDLTTEQVTVYASDGKTVAYTYEILYDADSEQYYAVIYFDESFINSAINGEITVSSLYFWVNGTVDSEDWEAKSDGSIDVTVGTETVNIPSSEITYTDKSETALADIDVSKTGSFDAATSTLSYTITVSTEKGTDGSITLTDAFNQTINSLGGIYIDESSPLTVTITKIAADGTETTYTETITDLGGENSSFTLTLDELDAKESYEITYSLTVVNSQSYSEMQINESVNNTVSVTTGGNSEMTEEETDKTKVTVDLLSKSGTTNTDGTITWTITVNTSQVNIAGFVLTDEMFADAVGGITVTDGNGTASTDDYTYNSTDNTITFNATDSDGDNNSTTNRNTYTITYTTNSTQTLGGSSVENEAKLTGDAGATSADAWGTGDNGSLKKECTDAVKDTSTNTAELTWTTTVTVPAGGIAAGTTIYDYLTNDLWNPSNYASGVPTTHQWYTYDQITTLFSDLSANGITLSDGTDISGSDLTLKAYCFTSSTATSGGYWVTYEELLSNTSASDYYYTAWSITFKNDVTVNSEATFTLSYSSTADTTNVIDGSNVTSYEYKNYISVGSLSASASKTLTNYKTVVKTNGSGKSDDTSVTITGGNDNTLTWIVKAYIDAGSSYQSITATDTLPDGVELSSISISGGGTASVTYENDAWTSNSAYVTADVTESNGVQTVVLTIGEDLYASLEESGGYVNITYTCKISDSVISDLMNGTITEEKFNNSATVKYTNEDGTDGPSDDDHQQQTVTYEEPAKSYLDKSYYWDNANDRLTYYVLVNPDEEDLLADGDELTFTDTMSTYADLQGGSYANLLYNTVTFYTLEKLEGTWLSDTATANNGAGYYIVSGTFVTTDGTRYSYKAGSTTNKIYVTSYDSDAYSLTTDEVTANVTVYLKTEVDVAWTYSEIDSGRVDHIITATVPDGKALLVEYAYQITYVAIDGGGSNYYNLDAWNTATLTGSASDGERTNDRYTEVDSGGGASYHNGFTLTKVDASDYGTKLTDATYALYAYDKDAGEDGDFVDTNVRITTDPSGTFSLSLVDDSGTLVSTITDKFGSSTITYDFTYNTLYYLVETTAPDGYLLDDTTKYYFYWSGDDTYTNNYPSDWTSYSTAYSPQYDLTTSSHTIAAKNTAAATTTIGVQKVWKDESGNDVTSSTTDPDTVEVELYRYTTSADSSDSGSSSNTVKVYWNPDSSTSTDATKYTAVGKVTAGEDAEITITVTNTAYTTGSWTIYIGGAPNSGTYYNYGSYYYDGTGSNSTTITIPAASVTGDIYIYTSNVTAVSPPVTYGSLAVTKTFDSSTPSSLDTSAVTFTITDSDGKTVATFGSSGYSGTLAVGTYTITESGADVSDYTRITTWEVDGKTYTGDFCNNVTVTDGGTTTVAVTNSYVDKSYVVEPTGSSLVGTYTISASDDWSLLISGLPATDSTGNTYYYYIKEVSGSGYTLVSYSDSNSGINQGTITVTNKLTEEEEEYTLPSAGGVGVWPYAAAGLALCGGAVWLLRRRWLAED